MRQLLIVTLAATLCLAGANGAPSAEPPHNNYINPESWLCRPGHDEACEDGLTTTIVGPDGKQTPARFHADPDAPIDCFYVYPTVSLQATPLSDMTADPEIKEVARQQFAPFAAKCRLFAPLYRQITVATLKAQERGVAPEIDPVVPARDVVDAWKSYIARDNSGRGFVLIGHSQGAGILKNIIAALIDGTPLAQRLVSAVIPGTDIDVLRGKDIGGTFSTIPLCHAADQTACVIVYSSFLASHPPGDDAHFGMSSRPVMRDGCVNPALLDTGRTRLDAYLPARFGETAIATIDSFFLKAPGLISARCVADAKHTYLAISAGGDRRAPDVVRYLNYVDRNPGWGLHDMDINLAMGNLIDIVGTQAQAWLAQNKSRAKAR